MFTRARFTVLCLAVALTSAVSQTALAAPEEDAGNRDQVRQKVLQKFDKNSNGQLDPDEREEAKTAMQKQREQGGGKGPGKGRGQRQGQEQVQDPERRQKLLAKFDTDGDGKLSDSEKAAAKETRAKRGQ
jgi:Ca2+-binding EF-hand superfamily protein